MAINRGKHGGPIDKSGAIDVLPVDAGEDGDEAVNQKDGSCQRPSSGRQLRMRLGCGSRARIRRDKGDQIAKDDGLRQLSERDDEFGNDGSDPVDVKCADASNKDAVATLLLTVAGLADSKSRESVCACTLSGEVYRSL